MIEPEETLKKLQELTTQRHHNGAYLISGKNLRTIVEAEILIKKLMELINDAKP